MSDSDALPESEAIVIGSIARSGGRLLDEIELTPDDFIINEAAWAYAAMQKMAAEATPIDPYTVGTIEPRVLSYVINAADMPLHTAIFHADAVRDAAIRRRLEMTAVRMRSAITERQDVSQIAERAQLDIEHAIGTRRQPLLYVGDVLDSVIEGAEDMRVRYPSPWQRLNDLIGGFRPGALYTIGARPGYGKSSIALMIAAAIAEHGPVAFSSLEMPTEELVSRIVAQGAGIPHHLLEAGTPIPPVFRDKIERWKMRAPHSIAIDDRSTVTVSDIRAHARAVKRPSGNLAGVVVDYLQLLSGPQRATRLEVVSESARQLKLLARDLECPVIALSQLNRNPEGRMDKKPTISDLRESGAIEQDSDVILLLHRDPMFEQPEGAPPLPAPLDVIVGKNRHGPTGVAQLTWEGSQMRAY